MQLQALQLSAALFEAAGHTQTLMLMTQPFAST
jgi:hypothetical protein